MRTLPRLSAALIVLLHILGPSLHVAHGHAAMRPCHADPAGEAHPDAPALRADVEVCDVCRTIALGASPVSPTPLAIAVHLLCASAAAQPPRYILFVARDFSVGGPRAPPR